MQTAAVDLELTSRILVALVLVGGSLSKLLNFRWFVGVVTKYELLPKEAAPLAALFVILFELSTGIMLVIGLWLPWPMYAALMLFLTLTSAVAVSLARGRFDLACGCNGFRKKSKVGWQLVGRNLGLMGFTLLSLGGSILPLQVVYPLGFLSLLLSLLAVFPEKGCHSSHSVRPDSAEL